MPRPQVSEKVAEVHKEILGWRRNPQQSADQERASFVMLINDYMTYLRARPQSLAAKDEAVEIKTADAFLKLISQPAAWNVAKHAEPDFDGFARGVPAGVCPPLAHIFSRVQSRMPLSLPALPSDRDCEREFIYRRIRKQVEVLSYYNSKLKDTDKQRQAEAEGIIATLIATSRALEDADTVDAAANSGGRVMARERLRN